MVGRATPSPALVDPWKKLGSSEGCQKIAASLPSFGLFCPRCVAREPCPFHPGTPGDVPAEPKLEEEEEAGPIELEDVDREEGQRRGGALLSMLRPGPPGLDGPPGTFAAWPRSCGTAHHIGAGADSYDASTDSGDSEAAFSIESDGSSAEHSQVHTLQRLQRQARDQHRQFQQQRWFGAAEPCVGGRFAYGELAPGAEVRPRQRAKWDTPEARGSPRFAAGEAEHAYTPEGAVAERPRVELYGNIR